MTASKKPKRPVAKGVPARVSASIADAARHLPPSGVAERLLTDERMETVWRFLLRQNVDQEAVAQHLLFNDAGLPTTWDAEQTFSPQQRAAAVFFVSVVGDLTGEPELIKHADADALAQPFLDAAKLCREMIRNAEGYQRGYDEAGQPLSFDLAKALDVVADCLEYKGNAALATNDPHVIKRSANERGDDALRVKTRLVAATMFCLYGRRNLGLTATVVTVATGVKIQKKDVENWCRHIPAYLRKSPNKQPR